MQRAYQFYYVLFILFIPSKAVLQSLSEQMLERIDSLFEEFNEGPPIAYSIVYNKDQVVKTYGSERYTCFESKPVEYRLASMSGHFTAFGILHLEQEGHISLTDEITDYISIPFGFDLAGVKILDLLNHTSGMPEYWYLKEQWQSDDASVFTTDDALKMLQVETNRLNDPGQNVAFSGTNYFMMKLIIEEVSGISLDSFSVKTIFRPLGMSNTRFISPTNPKDQIMAFVNRGNTTQAQYVGLADPGPSGVITTIEDIQRWSEYLLSSTDRIAIKLNTIIKTNDGQPAANPNGMITYGQHFDHQERGVTAVWDYGSVGGFASCFWRFPEENLAVCVLGKNGLGYNGYLGLQISEIILGEKFQEDKANYAIKYIPDPKELASYVGSYINYDYYTYREIISRNDSFFYRLPEYDVEHVLLPQAPGTFILSTPYDNLPARISNDTFEFTSEGWTYRYAKTNIESDNTIEDALVGTYYNTDLKTLVTIGMDGETYQLIDKDGAFTMRRINKNIFLTTNNQYRYIDVLRDEKNQILGITFTNSGYKKLLFKKV